MTSTANLYKSIINRNVLSPSNNCEIIYQLENELSHGTKTPHECAKTVDSVKVLTFHKLASDMTTLVFD